jgi:hypothetical protein
LSRSAVVEGAPVCSTGEPGVVEREQKTAAHSLIYHKYMNR